LTTCWLCIAMMAAFLIVTSIVFGVMFYNRTDAASPEMILDVKPAMKYFDHNLDQLPIVDIEWKNSGSACGDKQELIKPANKWPGTYKGCAKGSTVRKANSCSDGEESVDATGAIALDETW